MDADIRQTCNEITRLLLEVERPTTHDVSRITRDVCSRLSPSRIPRKQEILEVASGHIQLQGTLLKKPAKTGSGVAVVALMPKPYACPHGRCTYCPGGIPSNTPNSYTGSEPSAQSAIAYGYDPSRQIAAKIQHLVSYGHNTDKMELVIVGGTFLFMPADYRADFIKSCYDTLNGCVSPTLEDAKILNGKSPVRNVGFTIETKPDYCMPEHVDMMLDYGITRVEIGVQSLREVVYREVNRGHTFKDVLRSFQAARDAGLKIVAHMMPGLPGTDPKTDVADFRLLFEDSRLRPDMLKIYPALVLRDTPLYRQYAEGRYRPYTEREAIDVLSTIKSTIPHWVRINRIQREIPSADIVAGPRSGNLRQLVLDEMHMRGTRCSCIRCREPQRDAGDTVLARTDYDASGGHESFLSYVDSADQVHGFLRLRLPGMDAHRAEVEDACIVRELHVYGRSLGLGDRGGIQHAGLGRRLLAAAEDIARTELGVSRLLVISAVGTRPYYAAAGYSLYGPYMAKNL